MASVAVYRHVEKLQNFIDFCLSSSWPQNTTDLDDVEIRLFEAQDIEEIVKTEDMERLKEFLVNEHSNLFLEHCLADPPKYILRKIINSNVPVSYMDEAFRLFQNIFSEERLVNSLAESMVTAASTETLLRNIPTTLPEHGLLEVNSNFLLSEITMCESLPDLIEMIKQSDQQLMDLLVTCLLKVSIKYKKGVDKMVEGFEHVMSCKDSSVKDFWIKLFNVEDTNFIDMCLKHDILCQKIFQALKDSSEQMRASTQPSFVPFTLRELERNIEKISKNKILKLDLSSHLSNYTKFDNLDISD